jgi:uncharacterized protein YegJ (DUF2314 family)
MTNIDPTEFAIAVPQDDPEMQQAFLEARRTIESFIQSLRAPSPTQEYFAVKVRLSGSDPIEYVWVNEVVHDGSAFIGKPGDGFQARLDDIYDWMIVDQGRLVGGYTIRVARSKMTPESRAQLDASLWFTID